MKSDCGDDDAIPRKSSWYAQEPFNASLVAFRDNEGHEYRYMTSPLDEIYLTEPLDHFVAGTIPPEEREVRDTLVAAVLMRKQVSRIEFWWSQFFKPTQSYQRSLEYFRHLDSLCGLSPTYRAAFCRLSTSAQMPPFIRADLKRIVAKHDAINNTERN